MAHKPLSPPLVLQIQHKDTLLFKWVFRAYKTLTLQFLQHTCPMFNDHYMTDPPMNICWQLIPSSMIKLFNSSEESNWTFLQIQHKVNACEWYWQSHVKHALPSHIPTRFEDSIPISYPFEQLNHSNMSDINAMSTPLRSFSIYETHAGRRINLNQVRHLKPIAVVPLSYRNHKA